MNAAKHAIDAREVVARLRRDLCGHLPQQGPTAVGRSKIERRENAAEMEIARTKGAR